MRIKELPAYERPQEKLLYSGAESLSTSELLALIIRTGHVEKSAVQLAEDVLAYSASELGGLGLAEVKELTSIDGIGVSKACSILASVELAKRLENERWNRSRVTARRADEVAHYMMQHYREKKQEHAVALLLNAKCEIEAEVIISIGELYASPMHPREVFSPAIRRRAASIILVHNHPSGDPTPSEADYAVTRRLAKVSEIIGIPIFDHIIIGDTSYVSLRDEGILG